MNIKCAGQTVRGFTLVELLVVIGIIALLISILLPALNRARSSANTVKCLANLKQLATASIMYENDFNGMLPPIAYQGQGSGSYWPNALVQGKYIRSGSSVGGRQTVFQCPQGDPTIQAINGNTTVFTSPMSQISDYGQMDFWNSDYAQDHTSTVTSDYGANGIQAYSYNLGSSSLILGRPASEYFPFVTMPSDANIASGANLRPNAFKVSKAKQSSMVAMYFDGIFCHDRSPTYLTLRHGKPTGTAIERSSNFCFLDGHAETIKAADMPCQALGQANDLYNTGYLNTNRNGQWKVRFVVKPTA